MTNGARVGVYYFALVFCVGFALGVVRTLWLEPWLGGAAAVAVELPLILTASWFLCRWLISRLSVRPIASARFAMGATALALLLAAELALAVFLAGFTIEEHFAGYQSAAGALGLSGQLVYATFPLVQLRLSR